ncbi:HsdR family type I site-specific deoxyribonuclease [Sulfurovum sp.]|jgi:type I restriction enzyme R subunit|uniref:type I restriction endonuclease subunit R n=1 Tax=Sulfurovum sp. TaxID=1969726 RepID=UPI002A35E490|nr:HsdR family type I site-specific deoxyribonuclease [Sulfurovum sp.]MDY0402432.1 HsdR family type I site-specific deoxyribonuclease [Sulfurovum sp.]
MNPNISNETTIQSNTIELLKKMGYIFIGQEENARLRGGKLGEVILKDILLEQLQKINGFEYKGVQYKFSPKNIAKAIEELNVPLNEGLMIANQKISDKLMLGTSYDEELIDGVKKSFSLQYIDFKTPENNVYHFTEEYTVNRQTTTEAEKTRRPDLVLFINGIPFAVIELKKSSIDAEQGISQMIRNQGKDEIPHLFKYIQFTVAGSNHSPKYATTGTPKKFYAVWEEEAFENEPDSLIKDRTVSSLDKTIYSLFMKKRVTEILHSYVIFDNKVKKIARYQQFFAIKKIVKKINTFDNTGRRGGGLVWHTQGSGKSLTMAMLTKVIKRDIPGSKIIVVTDRKDLDRQIHTTFANSEIRAGRANSGHDLIEKLQSGMSVITTLIHKFETVEKEKMVLNDPNIFVLVDESHRTQGGDLHKSMKKVFENGCYLGFTGTPLLKREKSSIDKFGGLIHKYTIDQAVRDKAVLPLLYEGRLVDQWINDQSGLDRRFEMISRDLNDEQKADLKRKWARFQRIASSERRLEMIALDINEHFIKNVQGTGFKAMLATASKYEAIKYHTIFEEFGNIKTSFVISAPDTREGYDEVDESNKQFVIEAWNKLMKKYGDEERYLDKIKDEFIEGDEIELLIVVDKLLTGFDAPRAAILYIDKELKEHNLLQAIARVNRLYDGKDFGFIVDYRGLLGNLDQALTSYSSLDGFEEEDLVGAVIDIKEEVARVKTYYSHLQELFAPVGNKNDQESFEVFLGDEEKRKSFYELLSAYARALKLALSSDKITEVFSKEEIENYKKAMKFYSELRKSVKIRYHEEVDFGKYEKQMQKLLDTFISAEEVNQLTKLVNIFDEDFDKELERVVGDNARADTIISATTKVITEKREQNPAYYDKLSKRIQEILDEYKEGRLSDEEKLKHAKDIRAILMQKNNEDMDEYPEQIKHNVAARSLYDNLKPMFESASNNINNSQLVADLRVAYGNNAVDPIIQTVLKIDSIFKEASKKPDWENNNDVKNSIDQKIDDMLWELESKHAIKFDDLDTIISQIRSLGINNYAKK